MGVDVVSSIAGAVGNIAGAVGSSQQVKAATINAQSQQQTSTMNALLASIGGKNALTAQQQTRYTIIAVVIILFVLFIIGLIVYKKVIKK